MEFPDYPNFFIKLKDIGKRDPIEKAMQKLRKQFNNLSSGLGISIYKG